MDQAATLPATRGRTHAQVRQIVEQTERTEMIVKLALFAVTLGPPVLGALVHGHLGSAVLGGAISFLVAVFLYRLLYRFILRPLRSLRFGRAAKQLGQALANAPATVTQWLSWSSPSPGALAVTAAGELLIAERATNYDELRLTPAQILAVKVERETTLITDTREGGRLTLGAGRGLFGALTFGGTSRATTQAIDTAFLEIHYQLETNGVTRTAVVPFGNDRRGADALCATIARLTS